MSSLRKTQKRIAELERRFQARRRWQIKMDQAKEREREAAIDRLETIIALGDEVEIRLAKCGAK